eukprot:GILJ01015833.1.p1 GENE.GILJ01015833.1~~GILJ01015833.1.p1  ORF type:complete len:144 (+),score=23.11 GILJ01015833.1:438-869(+)
MENKTRYIDRLTKQEKNLKQLRKQYRDEQFQTKFPTREDAKKVVQSFIDRTRWEMHYTSLSDDETNMNKKKKITIEEPVYVEGHDYDKVRPTPRERDALEMLAYSWRIVMNSYWRDTAIAEEGPDYDRSRFASSSEDEDEDDY